MPTVVDVVVVVVDVVVVVVVVVETNKIVLRSIVFRPVSGVIRMSSASAPMHGGLAHCAMASMRSDLRLCGDIRGRETDERV